MSLWKQAVFWHCTARCLPMSGACSPADGPAQCTVTRRGARHGRHSWCVSAPMPACSARPPPSRIYVRHGAAAPRRGIPQPPPPPRRNPDDHPAPPGEVTLAGDAVAARGTRLRVPIVNYARNPKTQLAPPELLAVHPLGKSPVITDAGYTIAESGAIVEYLVGSYDKGRLCPAPVPRRASSTPTGCTTRKARRCRPW